MAEADLRALTHEYALVLASSNAAARSTPSRSRADDTVAEVPERLSADSSTAR
jgi:hypothetical protein